MDKTTTNSRTSVRGLQPPHHPSLLRGEGRLLYVQQFQGAISPKRAKVLLKEMALARKSFDRTIIKRR